MDETHAVFQFRGHTLQSLQTLLMSQQADKRHAGSK